MEAKYTVFTIRGRTGMVAGLELLNWERESEMADAVQRCITPKWWGQVRHISYDDPSRVIILAMRDMCPGLKVFSKDQLHLYIAFHRRHPGREGRVFLACRKLKQLCVKFGKRATQPGTSHVRLRRHGLPKHI